MNAQCKVEIVLSQPAGRFLVQNCTQTPVIIKDRHRRVPDGKFVFADGPLEALEVQTAEGVEPWLVILDKGSLGLPWNEWTKRFDDGTVEIKKLTEKGWEALDAKKS